MSNTDFTHDTLASHEWLQTAGSCSEMTPEKRLMLGILEIAWLDLTGKIYSNEKGKQRAGALRWIMLDLHPGHLFSFTSICLHLGFDANKIRQAARTASARCHG